ncbi:hypothetical protein L873DRAFT_1049311 [Choiromyces venosus 120613-1]|uniref:Uncharacterized protein n=1 Tax=Choiromyces venosus 120613-1 TaxID=1336337 RepID=A0A3N4JJ74_9PEZI|nr:hypothetical protein L873DRAFT_1049311 [Choiromyces venosus 120613-1]
MMKGQIYMKLRADPHLHRRHTVLLQKHGAQAFRSGFFSLSLRETWTSAYAPVSQCPNPSNSGVRRSASCARKQHRTGQDAHGKSPERMPTLRPPLGRINLVPRMAHAWSSMSCRGHFGGEEVVQGD